MFKQMFCELIVAFVNCLIMVLICAGVMIYVVFILVGNILAIFGFDGFINKMLGNLYGFLSDAHGTEYADDVTDWFRVVK